MRKHIAVATVAVSTVFGLGAGFAFGSPGLAGAQTASSTTAPATTVAAAAPATPKGNFVSDALAKLVKDGTITQSQADAVAKALQDARPSRGPSGSEGHGGRGHGGFGGAGGFDMGQGMGVVDAAAKALGITSDELIKQVTSGTTVAKIAESKGVALNTVVDAVVKEISAKLDAAVTAGKMTQADADAKKATLTQMVTDFANGKMNFGGKHGFGGHGGSGDHGSDPTDIDSPITPPTTTA